MIFLPFLPLMRPPYSTLLYSTVYKWYPHSTLAIPFQTLIRRSSLCIFIKAFLCLYREVYEKDQAQDYGGLLKVSIGRYASCVRVYVCTEDIDTDIYT